MAYFKSYKITRPQGAVTPVVPDDEKPAIQPQQPELKPTADQNGAPKAETDGQNVAQPNQATTVQTAPTAQTNSGNATAQTNGNPTTTTTTTAQQTNNIYGDGGFVDVGEAKKIGLEPGGGPDKLLEPKPNPEGKAPTQTVNVVGPDGKVINASATYDPETRQYIINDKSAKDGYKVADDQTTPGGYLYSRNGKAYVPNMSDRTYRLQNEKHDPDYKSEDPEVAAWLNGEGGEQSDTDNNTDAGGETKPRLFDEDYYNKLREETSLDKYMAMYQAGLIDDEEMKKRERAAERVNAIQHLGNIMNAFSNLYYTRGGAPSQTLPETKNPDIEKWRQTQTKNLNSYMDWSRKQAHQVWQREYAMMKERHKQEMDRENQALKKAESDAKTEIKKWEAEKAKYEAGTAEYKQAESKAEAARKEFAAKEAEVKAKAAQQKADDDHAIAVSTVGKNNAQAQAAARDSKAKAEREAADAAKKRAEADAAKASAREHDAKAQESHTRAANNTRQTNYNVNKPYYNPNSGKGNNGGNNGKTLGRGFNANSGRRRVTASGNGLFN